MSELLYGDIVEVSRELGNVSDEEISTDDITAGRKRATRLVNSYLEALIGSTVPWTSIDDVPNLINSITEDFAVYYIRRAKHPGPNPLDKNTKAEYWEKPIGLLEKIVNGEIKVPELSNTIADEVRSNRGDYTPISDLDGSIISEDLTEDIADDRD